MVTKQKVEQPILPRTDHDAEPHVQQDPELNVRELLEQLELDEQQIGNLCEQYQQYVDQKFANSSTSEEPIEKDQKNW